VYTSGDNPGAAATVQQLQRFGAVGLQHSLAMPPSLAAEHERHRQRERRRRAAGGTPLPRHHLKGGAPPPPRAGTVLERAGNQLATTFESGRQSGEEELMPSFSGATSALVAGLEDLNERTSGTIGLGAGALSELAGRVPTRFLLLLKRDMWTGDAGARLTLEVHLAMRVGVRLQLVLEQDPERGGCDFDEVCRETPKALKAAGLFKQLALPNYPGPHQPTSSAIILRALGAQGRAPQTRHLPHLPRHSLSLSKSLSGRSASRSAAKLRGASRTRAAAAPDNLAVNVAVVRSPPSDSDAASNEHDDATPPSPTFRVAATVLSGGEAVGASQQAREVTAVMSPRQRPRC